MYTGGGRGIDPAICWHLGVNALEKAGWGTVAAAYLAGVVGTMVQFSLAPVLPPVQARFGLNSVEAGWVMSLFAIATLATALPAGLASGRLGLRRIGVGGLVGMAAGLAAVAFALGSRQVWALWFGRAVEGLGFGLVAVAAPAAIGRHAAPRIMPWAMAIWATWVPVGALAMFFAGPRWAAGAHGLSWFQLGMAAVALVAAMGYAMRVPAGSESKDGGGRWPVVAALGRAWQRRPVVWAAAAFAAFTFGAFGFNTFVTSFFTQRFGWSLVAAGNLGALFSAAGGLGNLVAGFVTGRSRNAGAVSVLVSAGMTVLWLGLLLPQPLAAGAAALAASGVGGFVPTAVFAAPVRNAEAPDEIPLLMSLVIVGENVGIIMGPAWFGLALHLFGGWTVPFLSIALAAAFMTSCLAAAERHPLPRAMHEGSQFGRR